MSKDTSGRKEAVVRVAWPLATAHLWVVWYLLYGFAFAFINDLLTRVPSLTAENAMLPSGAEFALQLALAGVFGLAGGALLGLLRAPRSTWIAGAVMSFIAFLGTVLLWSLTSPAAGDNAPSYGPYLVFAAAMAAGCFAGFSVASRFSSRKRLRTEGERAAAA